MNIKINKNHIDSILTKDRAGETATGYKLLKANVQLGCKTALKISEYI